MTEDAAREWIVERFGQESAATLDEFIVLLRHAMATQNLISRGSLDTIWARHIVDSAQLVVLARPDGLWIDVGTGAGFPGIVTAIVSCRPTLLVEPRRRRVEFLQHVIDTLELSSHVQLRQARIETIDMLAGVLSARAVASLNDLLFATGNCADQTTQFLLPKGKSAREEVAQAQKSWHGTFHVEHSVTDPESMIVIANGVARR